MVRELNPLTDRTRRSGVHLPAATALLAHLDGVLGDDVSSWIEAFVYAELTEGVRRGEPGRVTRRDRDMWLIEVVFVQHATAAVPHSLPPRASDPLLNRNRNGDSGASTGVLPVCPAIPTVTAFVGRHPEWRAPRP